jgi:hypothetical protein
MPKQNNFINVTLLCLFCISSNLNTAVEQTNEYYGKFKPQLLSVEVSTHMCDPGDEMIITGNGPCGASVVRLVLLTAEGRL